MNHKYESKTWEDIFCLMCMSMMVMHSNSKLQWFTFLKRKNSGNKAPPKLLLVVTHIKLS